MAALSAELLLSERQASLLDDLSAAVGAGAPSQVASKDAEASEVTAFEAFHGHWHSVRLRQRTQEGSRRRGRWRWIYRVREICDSACGELDAVLDQLRELDRQRCDVLRKTTALHEQCEQMVQDQDRLAREAEALAETLDYFDRVADVACVLDHQSANGFLANAGTAVASAASESPDTEFGSVLDKIDGSISFLEAHPDFCQAQAYMSQFEHLRNRACLAMRSNLQRSLERSAAHVEQQLKDGGQDAAVVPNQVFYSKFRASAPNYRPLLSLLNKRVEVNETYAATLEEIEGFFVHLRLRLLTLPVSSQLQSIVHGELALSQLAPATRQASTYILEIAQLEKQCFEAYFELRHQQEALRTLLLKLADAFYQTMRPLVLACDSIDSLREIADCLQMDVLEPHRLLADVCVLGVVYRLHKDVQEKLIYRVEMYIREEIKGYVLGSSDLDYPSILYGSGTDTPHQETAMGQFQRGWYPTLPRTLSILAKIYRVLEMSTFQGLAQEAVDLCMRSLKEASEYLSRRSLPSCDASLQVFQPLVQMMDSQLFLVKHLLLLREQVAAFECELVVSEKYFNFANVWEALNLKLPDGILGILKPTVYHAEVDSKKDIESELKAACEALITNVTAHITQPLAAVNTKIGQFLASPGVDRSALKDQGFMQPDELRDVIGAFMANVKAKVPFTAAHIRLYLSAAPEGHTGHTGHQDAPEVSRSASTSPILWKPVEMRLVDTWGRLEGLLEEQGTSLETLGFPRPEPLRELIAALFNAVMEEPWENVVQMVSQVPRRNFSADVAQALPVAASQGSLGQPEAADKAGEAAPAPEPAEAPPRAKVPEAADPAPAAEDADAATAAAPFMGEPAEALTATSPIV